MATEVKHIVTGKSYYIFSINFHMADANPFIQFLLWDPENKCWMVDFANNYKPVLD